MRETRRVAGAALLLAIFAVPPVGAAQEPAEQNEPRVPKMVVDPPDATAPSGQTGLSGYVGSLPLSAQTYADPNKRFSFTAPQGWGRLPGNNPDEVTFQSPSGDSLRVSVASLSVSPRDFSQAYVDTYLGVLAQSFADVRFIGQRNVTVGGREAVDYVFTGSFRSVPVLCHQIVVLLGDHVLYITFAGFGSNSAVAEQFFLSTVMTFEINPAFGGAAKVAGPPFTMPIPEGWSEIPGGSDGVRTFRPPNARDTSPLIYVFSMRQDENSAIEHVDNTFVKVYGERIRGMFRSGMCEIQKTTTITLGGEPAVRFDLTYVTEEGGLRRVVLALCVRNGYVVGVTCDAADSGFSLFSPHFERALAEFKFA